ncbi:S-methyl-5-thioribose-1-phosphate isomerase [Paraburkholderia phosphatilytica]|uniref:S-methyl-5-thioribose-1-phosphate isomerase n=1 Tax=Paraburkholderia phosphatilytica TaxID=2282883 RepID=UPI000E4E3E1C|nr:S-methyl-5-thioribose-1-phosphate isomerase [Paraburkholderia phosphatilytica]
MVSSSHVLNLPVTLGWEDDQLRILDQTRLPQESTIETLTNAYEVWRAIHELRVRGAPAIGVAAAYGLCVAVRKSQHLSLDAFRAEMKEQAAYLDSARPTAVNLSWSLKRMQRAADRSNATDAATLYRTLVSEAQAIHREDQDLCERIGQHGAQLIRPGSGVLTHCNAGALATTGLGTATAPIYTAQRDGVAFRVFADETRPLLQGARLTAYELQRAGVDVTLITDSMAASLMAQGRVDVVIVGADRVAANGDFANKIGTLNLAIVSRHFGVPFYVACPSSTLDLDTPNGAGIVIEQRGGNEVTQLGGRAVAPPGIKVSNPAFDVTPHDLVTGYITEAGIIRAPFAVNLAAQFGQAA